MHPEDKPESGPSSPDSQASPQRAPSAQAGTSGRPSLLGRLLLGVFLMAGMGSGYMTWLCWRAGDSGQWLFAVFTVFFLMLGATPLFPKPKPKDPASIPSTRFVPHWFMMLAVLALVLIVLAIFVSVIRGL